MTDANNRGTSKSVRLTTEERGSAVIEVENLIGDYAQEDILCILMTATVNAIHVIEDKTERRRLEEEYVKALHFLSAVEEQFHGEITGEAPDRVNECMRTMMFHVLAAVGGLDRT